MLDGLRSRPGVIALVAAGAAVLVAAGTVVAVNIVRHSPRPSVTAGPSPTEASGVFVAGAAGIGDNYFPSYGNGGYDVTSYALRLSYDPATDNLSGSTTITAVASVNLSQFNLDFRGMSLQAVTVDGGAAQTSRKGDELTVKPSHGLTSGSTFAVVATYSGVPKGYVDGSSTNGFIATEDGAVAIGEPQVAASWFPVNDHPRDKATYTVEITVPSALVAVSNGVLSSKMPHGDTTTWTWSQTKPMAPYLASVVIGNYRLSQSVHNGLPVVLTVDATLPSSVDKELSKTTGIIDYLSSVFGPYPFDAMGGTVVDNRRVHYGGFALEVQTRPIYPYTWFENGEDASWVMAHELTHQWFGDSISVHDWKEIWLNEGFASYAEWLWSEHNGGETAQQRFDRTFADTAGDAWKVATGDPGKDDIFDYDVIYQRGAMILHVLRRTVGDAAFFNILKTWAAEKAGSNATSAEFIAVAERVSGKQLDALFDAWLYGTTRPASVPH